MIRISFLVLGYLLLIAGCASNNYEAQNKSLALPDTTSLIVTEDLRIAPLDLIRVSVFGVPEMDGDHQVDNLGRINMPLIGKVQAGGLMSFELARAIEEDLGRDYLKDPEVSVLIVESVGERVTIDGSVIKPGIYPITGKLTLLQAVALAGGPAMDANPKKVVVFRTIQGERQAAAFSLEDIRLGKSSDPQVYGNDIVVVDGSEARRNYGDFIQSVPLLALFLAF